MSAKERCLLTRLKCSVCVWLGPILAYIVCVHLQEDPAMEGVYDNGGCTVQAYFSVFNADPYLPFKGLVENWHQYTITCR